MTPVEHLYYAIGELAYAVAKADGRVQAIEKQKFQEMVARELQMKHYGFDVSAIIFRIMEHDKASLPDSYHWAITQIKQNSHYLSPEMKGAFIRVMELVAEAYPPVTIEEQSVMDRFREDVGPLEGDPLFYNAKP